MEQLQYFLVWLKMAYDCLIFWGKSTLTSFGLKMGLEQYKRHFAGSGSPHCEPHCQLSHWEAPL